MKKEPIAIVGMACRFPGGCKTPQEFWQLLLNESDAITEVNSERWSTEYFYHPDRGVRGKTFTLAAGQLDDVFGFDPAFFGISPREAEQMDPQQRLLLEMAWEALEDSGHTPDQLAGSNTSVYVGISSPDYSNNYLTDPSAGDGYFMTGNTLSIAANRISHMFDLHGPSMSVDTACSSSLVALHQACSSLWRGESDTSFCAAVHLLLSPFGFVGFSKASMLSPDGKCRPFSADANGYVRSEGGGVLMLKPLSKAEADGDHVHALLLTTGVNSDGHNASLITVPSTEGQSKLLESIYDAADIPATGLSYLEAHGTGTPVGDPVEAMAIGNAIGKFRPPNQPLPIGSVKSNVGHLEPASGMAGLIKVILALQNRAIPPTINTENPNPEIDFEALNLRIVRRTISISDDDYPLTMGVNSFGFGGSNAHAVLQEFVPTRERVDSAVELPPLFLSARSQASLCKRAEQLSKVIDRAVNNRELYDLFYAASTQRTRMTHGLCVRASSAPQMANALRTFAQDGETKDIVTVTKPAKQCRTAFVFSGNGSQWQGMARGLITDPIFRSALDDIDVLLRPRTGWSVIDELLTDPKLSRLDLTEVAQPTLFAVQVGLVTLLRAHDVEINAVIGHSVGEIAAAWAAGILDLEAAVHLIHQRSLAQGLTKGQGKMAALAIGPAAAGELIAVHGDGIELAAINSPNSVTLSGESTIIDQLAQDCDEKEIFCRILDLDYAFHSKVMDTVKDVFCDALGPIQPGPGHLPFYSTVTGQRADGLSMGTEYWWQNLRAPVVFGQAMENLINDGFNAFVEISPHTILQGYLRDIIRTAEVNGEIIPTLHRGDVDATVEIEAAVLRCCLVQNLSPRIYFPSVGNRVELPTYPWDKENYTIPTTSEAPFTKREHSLLGFAAHNMEGVWHNQISLETHTYLTEHVVDGAVVFPAAAFAEMALAASQSCFKRPQHEIANLEIRKPLILDEHIKDVQFVLNTNDYNFAIKSRSRLSNQAWTLHAVGRLINAASDYIKPRVDIGQIKERTSYIVHGRTVYDSADSLGISYGNIFQGLASVWVGEETLLGSVDIPKQIIAANGEFIIHPALLDSVFHTLFPAFSVRRKQYAEAASLYLPVAIGDLRFHGRGNSAAYSLCKINSYGRRSINASFILLDDTGGPLVELKDCVFRNLVRKQSKQGPQCYRFSQIARERLDPFNPPLPVPRKTLLDAAVQQLKEIREVREENFFAAQILPRYDALASAIAEDTLRQLGAHLEEFTAESLIRSAGIEKTHHTYLRFILDGLTADGKLEKRGEQLKLVSAPDAEDAMSIWRSLVNDHPDRLSDLVPTATHAFDLASLLTTSEHFDGPRHDVSWYLNRNRSSSFSAKVLRAVLADLLNNRAQKRTRLRIGEIGGGNSTFTASLLALLPADFCEYHVLSLNEDTQGMAEQDFAARKNVTVNLFETYLTTKPAEVPEFDILLVVDHLYECPSISQPIAAAESLLIPGGILLIADRRSNRLQDLTAGIKPNWWRRTTESGTPRSLLLEPDSWLGELSRFDFDEAQILTESIVPDAREYVIFARRGENDMPAETSVRNNWLLISDNHGESNAIAKNLAQACTTGGDTVVWAVDRPRPNAEESHTVAVNLESADGVAELEDYVRNQNINFDHVIFLPGIVSNGNGSVTDLMERQRRRCMGITLLLKLLESTPTQDKLQFWMVTLNAMSDLSNPGVTSFASNPAQASLWGFGRVVQNEFPDINCRLVDLQEIAKPALMADVLLKECRNADDETEVVLTGDARRALRLVANDQQNHSVERLVTSGYRLNLDRPGNFDDLNWKAVTHRLPKSDEVEIKVCAAGLNFRDVMYASGFLPDEMLDEGFTGATLGLECAGIVTSIGKDVRGVRTGDEVIAFAPACFASHVITPANTVVKKPKEWSFEAAATVPTAFFTVYYALASLAKLKGGEKILIHGATGGVGLAAIQYAKHCNAEIFATAGSPEKRRFLELLGVDHVFNSRTLDFADEIMAITNGGGIDVVLNSLAGEAIDKSLSVLRPCGRFLELGKRDYFENTRIGLRPFRHNIAYFGVDADQLIGLEPEQSRQSLLEVMKLFKQGVFHPLLHSVYHAADVSQAFRLMQQSHHIGKVILSLDDPPPYIIHEPVATQLSLQPDATYMITGGLSGLGMATAHWMAERGARELVLLARSGESEESRKNVIALQSRGVRVTTRACDVSDPVALQRVLREINADLPRLKGIVHAAMVLDDGLIRNLTPASLDAVMKPKVQGAWNLHQLTLGQDLDFFVMYSSVAACFGNPGQANYAAANAYLEALARYRHGAALPALTVAWDAITDTGYLARSPETAKKLINRMGIKGITSQAALATLDQLIAAGQPNAIVMDLNWQSTPRLLASVTTPKFSSVPQNVLPESGISEDGDLIGALAKHPESARRKVLEDMMVTELATILRKPANRIDRNTPVQEIGVDSLMSMELAMVLENKFGLDFPIIALTDSLTIAALADKIHTMLEGALRTHIETIRTEKEDFSNETGQDNPSTTPSKRVDDVAVHQSA